MELRKINIEDAFYEWQFITELPAEENGLENSYHGISYEEYVEKVLPKIMSYEHAENMPDWFVPEKNRAYVTGEDDEHLFMRIRKQ